MSSVQVETIRGSSVLLL